MSISGLHELVSSGKVTTAHFHRDQIITIHSVLDNSLKLATAKKISYEARQEVEDDVNGLIYALQNSDDPLAVLTEYLAD